MQFISRKAKIGMQKRRKAKIIISIHIKGQKECKYNTKRVQIFRVCPLFKVTKQQQQQLQDDK